LRSRERDPATTAYRYALDSDEWHHCDVRIVAERGVVRDFSVTYLAIIEDRLVPIARYDAAHGYPHRDTVDWTGQVVEKHWMPLQSLGEALDHAIVDFKANYQRYFNEFLARRSQR
jgi:hypothetical protein